MSSPKFGATWRPNKKTPRNSVAFTLLNSVNVMGKALTGEYKVLVDGKPEKLTHRLKPGQKLSFVLKGAKK